MSYAPQLHHHLRRRVHAVNEYALDALDGEERRRYDDVRNESLHAVLRGVEDDVLPKQLGQFHVAGDNQARLTVLPVDGSLSIGRTHARVSLLVSRRSIFHEVSSYVRECVTCNTPTR